TISINDITVPEGNSGTANANFTVTVTPFSGQTVTVSYSTADGSGIAGVDYVSTNGVLTFAPGVATQTISVPVIANTMNETNKNFLVNLSNPSNATIGDGQGLCTITNDDALPSITINDVTVSEGDTGASTSAVFNVRLSAISSQTVTVNYATADG